MASLAKRIATSLRKAQEEEDEFTPQDHQEQIDWNKVKFLKEMPPGAQRIHLYPIQDILRPRGSLQKESLSALILEELRKNFDYWTDPKYADSMSPEKVISILKQNLQKEVEAAWNAFEGS